MTDTRPHSHWKMVVAVSLLAFVSGAALGVAGTMHYISFNLPQFMGRPDRMPERLTRELRGKLGLTGEQAVQVQAIFEKGHEAMKRVRDEARPRMDEIMQQTHDEIARILKPEQQAAWQAWYDGMRRKFEPPRDGHDPHHPAGDEAHGPK